MSVDMTRSLELIDCCRPLAAETLRDDEADATARLFRALADPARVTIACEVIPRVGLAQATVSHHLAKLPDAGLLEREQRGKWAYFSLNREVAEKLEHLVQIPEVVT